MDIKSRELTTCDVAADGTGLSLGFIDAGGRPASLTLSLEQAGALLMTLPRLMEQALRLHYGDSSLRYTYPLGSWTLEHASTAGTGIVTLSTPDGFSVRFAMGQDQLEQLGEALSSAPVDVMDNRAVGCDLPDPKTSMH